MDQNIKEMIYKWSKRFNKDLEHVKDGENLFIDKEDDSNYELTEPIN